MLEVVSGLPPRSARCVPPVPDAGLGGSGLGIRGAFGTTPRGPGLIIAAGMPVSGRLGLRGGVLDRALVG